MFTYNLIGISSISFHLDYRPVKIKHKLNKKNLYNCKQIIHIHTLTQFILKFANVFVHMCINL